MRTYVCQLVAAIVVVIVEVAVAVVAAAVAVASGLYWVFYVCFRSFGIYSFLDRYINDKIYLYLNKKKKISFYQFQIFMST